MEAISDAMLLRVFVGEEDHHAGQPLYKAIVEKARATGLAGATVLQAPLGFGPSRRFRSELNVDAGDRLPIVVEIVDSRAKIDAFLPVLHDLVESGLVTLEGVRAHVIRSKPRPAATGGRVPRREGTPPSGRPERAGPGIGQPRWRDA